MNNEQKAQLLPSASLEQNGLLSAGEAYKFGDFTILTNDGDLKIIVHNPRLRLIIMPKTDNSCVLRGVR
jgi:hypothetical protein